MFKEFLSSFIDLVYPPRCILCKNPLPHSKNKNQLCQVCEFAIVPNRPPFCSKCSRPLTTPSLSFCKACAKTPFHFDQAWGTCLYTTPMKKLIHLFKYGDKTALRYHFFERMASFIEIYHLDLSHFDLIIPVPLHNARLRERGFNQAQILAQMIAEEFNIPQTLNNLKRFRLTKNQAALNQKERWTNIQGAFTIKCSGALNKKNILLVDDLFTTGATSSEAARVLKQAGASKVSVLTLAIAI